MSIAPRQLDCVVSYKNVFAVNTQQNRTVRKVVRCCCLFI